MHNRHENFERKSPQMRRALEFLLGDGLFISDGETWKKRRPLVADIVHKTRVPEFGRPMQDVSAEFVTRWEHFSPDQHVNVLTQMAELTAEIIARAVFGNNLGSQAAYEVIDGFTRYQNLIDSFNLGYFMGADDGLPILRGPRLRASVRKVNTVIDKVIEDHLAGRGDQSSMIELLIRRQARNPELGLDQTALRHEAATIFMAGHETTAATLTWVWYLLSHAPWIEEELIQEIETVTGGAMPSINDVPRLEWCRAVIEETLRLYPPVPILARQAKEADEIEGRQIKPASLALVVPWLLHRAEDLWDAPHHFKPERFLGDKRPIPYSYIPFAIGPRICAGLNFGLSESILCLAILIQRFKIRVVDNYKVEPICRLTLRPKDGLMVHIGKRTRG
jgi:cytochrome P450